MSQLYTVHTAEIAANSKMITDLWLEGFAQSTAASTQRKLEQMYLNNPYGQGVSCLLREEKSGNNVGVQCLVPRKFSQLSETFNAGIMADYMVLAKYRSLGPALQLLKGCTAQGMSDFDFIYGFPNTKSNLIFKRAGLLPAGNVVRYAKLLRSHSFMQGSVSSWLAPIAAKLVDFAVWLSDQIQLVFHNDSIECREVETFGEAFDKLWREHSNKQLILSERSAQALAWRYPQQNIFVAEDKKLDCIVGYCVWSEKNGIAIIHDFFCKNMPEHLEALMRNFSRFMRQRDISSISVEFSGPATLDRLLSKADFIAREKSPIYIMMGNSQKISADANWYFTGFDRDTD